MTPKYKPVSKQDALKQFLADSEEFYRTYYVARSVDGPKLKATGALPIAALLNHSGFTFYVEAKPLRIEHETAVSNGRFLECIDTPELKPGTKVKVTIEEIV